MRSCQRHHALCLLLLLVSAALPAAITSTRTSRSHHRNLLHRIHGRALQRRALKQADAQPLAGGTPFGAGAGMGDAGSSSVGAGVIIGYIPVYGAPAYGSLPTSAPTYGSNPDSTPEVPAIGVIVGYLPIYDSEPSDNQTPSPAAPPMYGSDAASQAAGVPVASGAGIFLGNLIPIYGGPLSNEFPGLAPAYPPILPAALGMAIGAGVAVTISDLIPAYGTGAPIPTPTLTSAYPPAYTLPNSLGVGVGAPIDVVIGAALPAYGGPSGQLVFPPAGSNSPSDSQGTSTPVGGVLPVYIAPLVPLSSAPPPPSYGPYGPFNATAQGLTIILGYIPFIGVSEDQTPASQASPPAYGSDGSSDPQDGSVTDFPIVIGDLPAYGGVPESPASPSSPSQTPGNGADGSGTIIGYLPVSQALDSFTSLPTYGGYGGSGSSGGFGSDLGFSADIGYIVVFDALG